MARLPHDGEKGKTPSMQLLMPDSGSPKAERPVQQPFTKASIFSYLAIATSILAIHCWLHSLPNRSDRPDRLAAVRFIPVHFAPSGFAPLRLAGAWKVEVDDPRFGGVSVLALDKGGLLALSDSGTLVLLPKPGRDRRAFVRDLPAGPGTPRFKHNRDSEALAPDPDGRGWWVAFERWNQLWLYDPSWRRALGHIDLGRDRWRANRGIEAMVADGGALTAFPESGREWLDVRAGRMRVRPLQNSFGYIADGVRLADGRLLLVTREFSLAGIVKTLVAVDENGPRPILRALAQLRLGAIDNIEAVAAEPRRGGGTRLWLMTDDDFRPQATTLLVALDLP